MINTFKPTMMVINTSDVRYATIGCDTSPSVAVSAGLGRAFYQRLFDFTTPSKQPLEELLQEALGGQSIHGKTVILAFSRVPSEFPEWFQNELIKLRAKGIHTYIVILLLMSALPCQWTQISVLVGSQFHNRMFDTFRLQDTMFTPNALTVVTAGASPSKVLKKIKAITFFTGDVDNKLADNMVSWRATNLHAFSSSHRLVFDFPVEKSLSVQACLQVLAVEMNGEIPHNVYPSHASTPIMKRKALHISFLPSEAKPDSPEVLIKVATVLQNKGMTDVLVGWEHSFLLPEDAYIITFDSVEALSNTLLKSKLTEILLVSAFKAIIKTDPRMSTQDLKHILAGVNSTCVSKVRKLLGFDGRFLWQDHSEQVPNKSAQAPVTTKIELTLQGAPHKRYKEFIHDLLSSAQSHLQSNGFTFSVGIVADWNSMKKKRNGPVTVQFPDLLTARGFHYQYKDYEWESSDGAQTMIIRLGNEMFDEESARPHVRTAVASAPHVTPAMVTSLGRSVTNS